LKVLDAGLANFFVALFARGERESLLQTLPLEDPRNPAHHFLVESGFKAVIDEEVRRRTREMIAARQGLLRSGGAVPDAGFKELIGRLAGAPSLAKVVQRSAQERADPDAFRAFVEHFNLLEGV
ncbi:MAG TPA: hypothetical protein VG944_20235, partial [Fimbriimonas sp.]|nr:hypothetical protein [Fimbriimonas sp.]